jgi:hypothetical protein
MSDINTGGLKAAPLNNEQMDNLLKAEKLLNKDKKSGEIYLLAVTR